MSDAVATVNDIDVLSRAASTSLAGVETQLQNIRSHVINSLGAKRMGSERIAGTLASHCSFEAD